MTIEAWLHSATVDAERRGLPNLKPLLESLAQATRALREADVHESAIPGDGSPRTGQVVRRHEGEHG